MYILIYDTLINKLLTYLLTLVMKCFCFVLVLQTIQDCVTYFEPSQS